MSPKEYLNRAQFILTSTLRPLPASLLTCTLLLASQVVWDNSHNILRTSRYLTRYWLYDILLTCFLLMLCVLQMAHTQRNGRTQTAHSYLYWNQVLTTFFFHNGRPKDIILFVLLWWVSAPWDVAHPSSFDSMKSIRVLNRSTAMIMTVNKML